MIQVMEKKRQEQNSNYVLEISKIYLKKICFLIFISNFKKINTFGWAKKFNINLKK
jgi:hypothetical protein